jgi:hypothetical protein
MGTISLTRTAAGTEPSPARDDRAVVVTPGVGPLPAISLVTDARPWSAAVRLRALFLRLAR